jgi:hypothetical protein
MVKLELPHINLLTKLDLCEDRSGVEEFLVPDAAQLAARWAREPAACAVPCVPCAAAPSSAPLVWGRPAPTRFVRARRLRGGGLGRRARQGERLSTSHA